MDFVLKYSFDTSNNMNTGQIVNGDFSIDPSVTSDGWSNDAVSGGINWSDGTTIF